MMLGASLVSWGTLTTFVQDGCLMLPSFLKAPKQGRVQKFLGLMGGFNHV